MFAVFFHSVRIINLRSKNPAHIDEACTHMQNCIKSKEIKYVNKHSNGAYLSQSLFICIINGNKGTSGVFPKDRLVSRDFVNKEMM